MVIHISMCTPFGESRFWRQNFLARSIRPELGLDCISEDIATSLRDSIIVIVNYGVYSIAITILISANIKVWATDRQFINCNIILIY